MSAQANPRERRVRAVPKPEELLSYSELHSDLVRRWTYQMKVRKRRQRSPAPAGSSISAGARRPQAIASKT